MCARDCGELEGEATIAGDRLWLGQVRENDSLCLWLACLPCMCRGLIKHVVFGELKVGHCGLSTGCGCGDGGGTKMKAASYRRNKMSGMFYSEFKQNKQGSLGVGVEMVKDSDIIRCVCLRKITLAVCER